MVLVNENRVSERKQRPSGEMAVLCTWPVTELSSDQEIIFRDQGSTQKAGMSSRISARQTDFTEVSRVREHKDAAGTLPALNLGKGP